MGFEPKFSKDIRISETELIFLMLNDGKNEDSGNSLLHYFSEFVASVSKNCLYYKLH